MVFWEKRAIGFSHEIKYLTSMQRGQIIGATMCLHISILSNYLSYIELKKWKTDYIGNWLQNWDTMVLKKKYFHHYQVVLFEAAY